MTLEWMYDGVNTSVPRNAGKECSEYLSTKQKFIETIIFIVIGVIGIKWSINRLKSISTSKLDMPNLLDTKNYRCTPCTSCSGNGKVILLTVMSVTFGMELGFKFASRSVIYILNPCHITTIIQIYLLAAKPSRTITILFRIQMNYLNGPLLAFLFPETDSRVIPMEVVIYWLQHGLMFIIPIYLLSIRGAYTMEDISDWNWNILSYCIFLIYHFILLNAFSIPTQVNLNHLLCPAIKDPFQGAFYRIAACIHQAILCPILCKIFVIIFGPTSSSTSLVVNSKGLALNSSSSSNVKYQINNHSNFDTLKNGRSDSKINLIEKVKMLNNISINGDECINKFE